MTIRLRKVLRDVWLHQARTWLVIAAIAIGIVGAGAVLTTWALLRRVTTDGYLATNPAAAELRTERLDTALLERVRAHPAVADVQARRTVTADIRIAGIWGTAHLFVVDDYAGQRIHTVRPQVGAWPPPDGAIVIERSSVAFAGAALGDSALVQVGEKPRQALRIAGFARDQGLAPGWMEHVVYGFVSRATLVALGAGDELDRLQFTVRDRRLSREAIRAVAAEVAAIVRASGRAVRTVEVPEGHIHAGQMNSLLMTQGAFGALALLLSAFLVVNLIAAMLAGQVREIGVMKTLGARAGQIGAMYLGLAFVLGLAACVVAVPLAVVLGMRYAGFSAELLNFDLAGHAVPVWAILTQVAVGSLLPVAAAAVPVTRGCRIGVAEALRDQGLDARAGLAPGPLLRRIGGVGRPLLLSLRNAFRRRQRMALTLVTLALGGAVYLGALNLRTSIRGSVGYLYGTLLRHDLTLRFAVAHDPDSLMAAAAHVPGVLHAEAWGGAGAAVLGADSLLGSAFPFTFVPPRTRVVNLPLDAGRWLAPDDRGAIVISRRLALANPGLRLGAPATLVIDGRPTTWTVVGIVMSGPLEQAFASLADLEVWGTARTDRLLVTAADSGVTAHSDLMLRLRGTLTREGLAVANGQLVEESRRVMEDHLLMAASFLLVMSQVMIVVGGLGLASTMSLAVLERTREIGVLRAIGARHRSIHLIIQAEGLLIALLAWALAIPLSLPMSVVVGRRFGQMMIPVAVTWVPDAAAVLWWLLLVVVVSLVACLWPAWRATRIPTAAALAWE